jgi:hypothetical protein
VKILTLSHHTYDVVWPIGLAAAGVCFVVFETWAFIDGKPDTDTLSGHVWAWVGTRRGWSGWRVAPRLALLVFLLWLAEHFTFGWF